MAARFSASVTTTNCIVRLLLPDGACSAVATHSRMRSAGTGRDRSSRRRTARVVVSSSWGVRSSTAGRLGRPAGRPRTLGAMGDVTTTEIATAEGRFTADVAGPADGPVVLLLHGFPQTRHTWRDVLGDLAARGRRAVAVDQRGYSPGVRPEAVEAYATPRLVADVLDLADALGAERFDLVGHD